MKAFEKSTARPVSYDMNIGLCGEVLSMEVPLGPKSRKNAAKGEFVAFFCTQKAQPEGGFDQNDAVESFKGLAAVEEGCVDDALFGRAFVQPLAGHIVNDWVDDVFQFAQGIGISGYPLPQEAAVDGPVRHQQVFPEACGNRFPRLIGGAMAQAVDIQNGEAPLFEEAGDEIFAGTGEAGKADEHG